MVSSELRVSFGDRLCSPPTILLVLDDNYMPLSLTYSQIANILRLLYVVEAPGKGYDA